MTKREQQHFEFVRSIDTSEWKQYSSFEKHFRLSHLFIKYHEMMMDYRTLNTEQYVKKSWLQFYRDRTDLLSINEEKINNQKSNFSIDYDSSAIRIINQIVTEISYKLNRID
jgi:hypothetical protein